MRLMPTRKSEYGLVGVPEVGAPGDGSGLAATAASMRPKRSAAVRTAASSVVSSCTSATNPAAESGPPAASTEATVGSRSAAVASG